MGRHLIETIMGAVVLLVAGFFLVFAYTHSELKAIKGYSVSAQFTSVGGLDVGADVRINGIKVGTVTSMVLDPTSFNAVVKMAIRPDIKLPVDTVASVSTEGLLGGKFIRLEPGRSGEDIAAGGDLAHTKEHKSIEELVGDLIFLATAEQPAASKTPGAAAPSASPAEAGPAPGADRDGAQK
ncbi:MAG: outer membrane lipid asymmetry maintenance protein MlaD [Magnetospirillum sp.]|nr:outer membrane lipid asymmetry maintenance protein MlaD [Magnetospirillum sp.]